MRGWRVSGSEGVRSLWGRHCCGWGAVKNRLGKSGDPVGHWVQVGEGTPERRNRGLVGPQSRHRRGVKDRVPCRRTSHGAVLLEDQSRTH